jgi:hypothetical protein
MITFNDILRSASIDPAGVRLVRHEDASKGASRVYATWRQGASGRHLVEEYQQLQGREVFDVGDILASFAVTPRPRRDTVFIGLFRVLGVKSVAHATDPIYGHAFGPAFAYDIKGDPSLADYVGRLVIDWGAGTRSWVQRASRQDKPVLSIQEIEPPPWPGFAHFCVDIEDVPGLYPNWQEVLRTVKGIYLLVDVNTGDQYVGSAKGEENLLGRFMNYAVTGHGGNVELRGRKGARYRVSLLEVVDLSLPDQRIEAIEGVWKKKLMSREFGLNRN